MSHHSDFSLTVLEQSEISHYFGKERAQLFMAKEDGIENTNKVAMRYSRGFTRSDWFKWTAGDLIKQTSYKRLQFLSETACTHIILGNNQGLITESYLDSLNEADEQRDYFITFLYTVITADKIPVLLDDFNQLLLWCANNIAIVSNILEESEQAVKTALENAQFYSQLNDADYGEEGQGADFFFCALKSMQSLLSYANTHQLIAVYENNNCTGLEWLKKYRPCIISFD